MIMKFQLLLANNNKLISAVLSCSILRTGTSLGKVFPVSAAASIYLHRHTPSDQSRVYGVTQLRTEGDHCREPAGTAPVVLKVIPVTGAAYSGITMDQLMCASLFPHPVFHVVDIHV